MDQPSRLKPWRVLHSRVSYSDRWLTLRTDTCETPTGYRVEAYHVIDYPGWINIVALVDQRRMLLLREYRHGVGQVVAGLPGGMMDAGETDPVAAARRELLEETGFAAERLILCGDSFANAASQTNRVWAFLAPDAVRVGGQSLDDSEDIEVMTVDLPDVVTQMRRGRLPFSASHMTVLWQVVSTVLSGTVPGTDILRQALLDDLATPWGNPLA
jgi:8-oxo-dGTP pyrophosphatase MutT (NUDIX family)